MVNELRVAFWPIVGSVIIAVGASTVGLYAFEGRTPIVMLGFLVFIAGYRISQLGVHTDKLSNNITVNTNSVLDSGIISRLLLIIIGWIAISIGVTMFSQTILNPSLSNAIFSGISSITGYMCAHVGINGVGLGDSFFGPVLTYLQHPKEE